MDQQKIGSFLKKLRNEKNLTQEQLAEKLGTSRRTVSRWETGSNMPDLTLLMELSSLYEVELRELLEGERKNEKMNKELEETVWMIADYSNEEKLRFTRVIHWLYMIAIVSSIGFLVLFFMEPEEAGFWYSYLEGMCIGIPIAMVGVGAILTSKYAAQIRIMKKKILKRVKKFEK